MTHLENLEFAFKLGTFSVINDKISNDRWIQWLFFQEVTMISDDDEQFITP